MRRLVRNVRLTVPICLILICGSFAAATLLSMRMDRAHALNEASLFESARARDLAAVAGANLDRMAEAGILYADNPGTDPKVAGLHNIAVFDKSGAVLSSCIAKPFPRRRALPSPQTRGSLLSGKQSGHRFAHDGKIIAVTFDPALLAPASLLRRAALLLPDSSVLAGGWQDSDVRSASVPGAVRKHWPVTAVTFLDSAGALDAWYGALPLYLFVILGPAIAGGWLAALLVGAFERQQKAAHAIRSLRSVRPVEARLMVRLAGAERAAVEAARSKSEFIAHMSHELRTPLNAVIGFSEVIGQEFYGPAGHPKYVEYARDIADAGRNLHAKIGDILEFSNIEAGRYPLHAGICRSGRDRRGLRRRTGRPCLFPPHRFGHGLCRTGTGARRPRCAQAHLSAICWSTRSTTLLRADACAWISKMRKARWWPASSTAAQDFPAPNSARPARPFSVSTAPARSRAPAWAWPSRMELARRHGWRDAAVLRARRSGCVMELRLLQVYLPHR